MFYSERTLLPLIMALGSWLGPKRYSLKSLKIKPPLTYKNNACVNRIIRGWPSKSICFSPWLPLKSLLCMLSFLHELSYSWSLPTHFSLAFCLLSSSYLLCKHYLSWAFLHLNPRGIFSPAQHFFIFDCAVPLSKAPLPYIHPTCPQRPQTTPIWPGWE